MTIGEQSVQDVALAAARIESSTELENVHVRFDGCRPPAHPDPPVPVDSCPDPQESWCAVP